MRGAEPTVRGIGNLLDIFITVDISGYDGVSYRTVSGWKHSSTKVTFAGVLFLKRGSILEDFYFINSIDSGTVFYFTISLNFLSLSLISAARSKSRIFAALCISFSSWSISFGKSFF